MSEVGFQPTDNVIFFLKTSNPRNLNLPFFIIFTNFLGVVFFYYYLLLILIHLNSKFLTSKNYNQYDLDYAFLIFLIYN